MDYKKIFWGTFLIIIGTVVLLKHNGIINFHFFQLLYLWPVFLLYLGITMLPLKNNHKLILTLVSLLLVIFMVYFFTNHYPSKKCPFRFHNQIEQQDQDVEDI